MFNIPNFVNIVDKKIERRLSVVYQWSFIRGRQRKQTSPHTYTMRDDQGTAHPLEVTRVERDLGVLVSHDLKFGPQCKSAAAMANWKFGLLKKVFISRDQRLWTTLWQSQIRPHIEHAIQVWSPYLAKDIKTLERVQRRVSKHMDGMKGKSYQERLEALGWTTLVDRRLRGDLIFAYRVHHCNNADDHQAQFVHPIVNLDWRWAQPIEGPAGGTRANDIDVRVKPLSYGTCAQRSHFITSRVEAPLKKLPKSLMRKSSVNQFKNGYDLFIRGKYEEADDSTTNAHSTLHSHHTI